MRTPIRAVLRVLVFGAMPLMTACAVGPDYHRPALPPSDGYGAAETPPRSAIARLAVGADIPAQWWEIFHSQALDDLVAQALRNNPTIDAANAALRQAKELTKAQRGAYYPTVSTSISPSRQHFADTLASPLANNSDLYDLTTAQVSVSYTPDLFGANRRTVESLVAQQDQQRFNLEAARLTLASNVVLAAIQDASLRAQITATRDIVENQRKILAIFQRQADLGQTSKADLAAQTALLAQTEASLPPLEKQFAVNRDLLAALVGRTPGEPVVATFDLDSLSLPAQLPLSVPALLVEHRPDVRIAEAQLHTASAQIGMAVAARLPNLEIDANAGSAALALTPSFNSMTEFWSVAATLTQPIFDAGTLLHKQRSAEAAYDQAAAQYRSTVVGAFQNTADTLHAVWSDGKALQADEVAANASRGSLEIARRQLVLGDVSQLTLFTVEQTETQAQLFLLQAKATQYSDVVALFQALGGGWWNRDSKINEGQAK